MREADRVGGPWGQLWRADALHVMGRITEARQILDTLANDTASPVHAWSIHELSVIASFEGHHTESLALVDTAIRITVKPPTLWIVEAADLLCQLNRYAEAQARLEPLLAAALEPGEMQFVLIAADNVLRKQARTADADALIQSIEARYPRLEALCQSLRRNTSGAP